MALHQNSIEIENINKLMSACMSFHSRSADLKKKLVTNFLIFKFSCFVDCINVLYTCSCSTLNFFYLLKHLL